MIQTKVAEKIKTYILCSVLKILLFCYCRSGQATDDNMAHTHCLLDTCLQTHTQNMLYLLLFYCKIAYTNASDCYIIGTLLVLFCYKKR